MTFSSRVGLIGSHSTRFSLCTPLALGANQTTLIIFSAPNGIMKSSWGRITNHSVSGGATTWMRLADIGRDCFFARLQNKAQGPHFLKDLASFDEDFRKPHEHLLITQCRSPTLLIAMTHHHLAVKPDPNRELSNDPLNTWYWTAESTDGKSKLHYELAREHARPCKY